MDVCAEQLILHLSKCRHIINKGYINIQNTRLSWLNNFCLEFLKLSQQLQKFLFLVNEHQSLRSNGQVDIVYLCLTQIVTCIKYMERTVKAEEKQGNAISASRQHFLDRIHWCLDRLRSCIKNLKMSDGKDACIQEENTFVDLMDVVLDQLSPYTSYKDEKSQEFTKSNLNVAEENAQAMFASRDIRSKVDLILSHTLAFANVALKQDKKALSALCQKVLRECMTFQEECALGVQSGVTPNESNRRLKGISLENALYQLEDHINESLLRLVFTCFLDYSKLSVDKLRTIIRERDADDPELDELIADFDVNIDRTTQIGMFAIAFAPNVKIKTIVRSCLASFESLDSCIIPSLQSKATSDAYAQLLEQHFNDEVSNFKNAIQEIIDSYAFTSCYYDLLSQAIKANEKEYSKHSLVDIIKLGGFLYDHFQLEVNQKELRKNSDLMEIFRKFTLILNECQAVLICSDVETVQPERVLKRFKILRSIVRKLIDGLGGPSSEGNPLSASKSQILLMSDELTDSQRMFASIGISPSICSILYNKTPTTNRRRQVVANDSLKAVNSKLPLFTPPEPATINRIDHCTKPTYSGNVNATQLNSVAIPPKSMDNLPRAQVKRYSVRRKESLRTAMFKKQKTDGTQEIYDIYKSNSASLQISEILDQLTSLSSNFPESTLDKSIISKK